MNSFFVFKDSKSDTSLRCPLRQTLPIFKQPVTYYPSQRDEVKSQVTTSAGKPSEKTKPRQLFWEKRFENLRPMDIDGEPFEHFQLPEQIKSIVFFFKDLFLIFENKFLSFMRIKI